VLNFPIKVTFTFFCSISVSYFATVGAKFGQIFKIVFECYKDFTSIMLELKLHDSPLVKVTANKSSQK
jgi:hypothetical protein